MSSQNQPVLPPKIYSEAIVRSISGASLLRYSHPVTSENVTQFYAEPERVELAVKRLKAAGFEVLEVGFLTISIAAQAKVYERSFQTTLEAIERPVITEMGEISTTLINSVDGKPFGEIDTSKTLWDDLLDGVAINEPVYYSRPTIPTSEPPEKTANYLNVPDDVAQGLNANLVHQNGITGKGVRIVMIDSGWYDHPFFREHNYNVKVILAPGATNPEEDISGHGTGESANIFAIAPETELTMIKFGVVVDGKISNVDAMAAFKRAIDQRPDIISCSWGSDQKNRQLSPQDKLLAAAVASAVYEGIVVIFSAGNGQWGFPAQHPEAIAVGGVYKHLEGSLKGLLEASNYASSFISPVYPGRRVPDVCGLVGQLPYGAYIRLPVPPGSRVDRVRSAAGDGTLPLDGWAVFSGTSAAAPQLAGICALLKQVNPSLSPARVKQILQQTARDVTVGFSNPSTGGNQASPGVDLATGYGLADADAVVQAVINISKGHNKSQFSKLSSSNSSCLKELQNFNYSLSYLIQKPETTMNPDYPKLKQNLEKILWEFEKILEQYDVKELEISINESNFLERSLKSKTVRSLRKSLDKCFPLDKNEITKGHILAAQSLLKLKKYQETALEIITEVITNEKYSSSDSTAEEKSKTLRELALEALGEISNLEDVMPSETNLYCGACINGRMICNGNSVSCSN